MRGKGRRTVKEEGRIQIEGEREDTTKKGRIQNVIRGEGTRGRGK